MKDILISKLGKTKAGNRSRIWLQGARLIAANFKAGSIVGATWQKDRLTLELDGVGKAVGVHQEMRTVSGSKESPVIDIVGKRVIETFGKAGAQVEVEFKRDTIVIKPAKK